MNFMLCSNISICWKEDIKVSSRQQHTVDEEVQTVHTAHCMPVVEPSATTMPRMQVQQDRPPVSFPRIPQVCRYTLC